MKNLTDNTSNILGKVYIHPHGYAPFDFWDFLVLVFWLILIYLATVMVVKYGDTE